MSEDVVQATLALIETCIQVEGERAQRILPWRLFTNPDRRNNATTFLKDMNYISVTRKGAVINPSHKNLAGLKRELENRIPLLRLTSSSPQSTPTTSAFVRRGRPPGKRGRKKQIGGDLGRGSQTARSAAKPLPRITSLTSPVSRPVQTSATARSGLGDEFQLIEQTYGPVDLSDISNRSTSSYAHLTSYSSRADYMGVVRFFGVNLPIPAGTLVWPVDIKMDLEEQVELDDKVDTHDDQSTSSIDLNNTPDGDEFESEYDDEDDEDGNQDVDEEDADEEDFITETAGDEPVLIY